MKRHKKLTLISITMRRGSVRERISRFAYLPSPYNKISWENLEKVFPEIKKADSYWQVIVA